MAFNQNPKLKTVSRAPSQAAPVRSGRKQIRVQPYSRRVSNLQGSAPIARRRREQALEGAHSRSNLCRRARQRPLDPGYKPKAQAVLQRTNARLRRSRSCANGRLHRPPVKNRLLWKLPCHRTLSYLEAFPDSDRPPGGVSGPEGG